MKVANFIKLMGTPSKTYMKQLFICLPLKRCMSRYKIPKKGFEFQVPCIFTNMKPFLFHNEYSSLRFFSLSAMWQSKDEDIEMDEDEKEVEIRDIFSQVLPRVPFSGHRVFVIQPYIKWGPSKRENTTPELQLQEATALVASLPKWSVENKVTVPLRSFEKKALFGSGTLEKLRKNITENENITAVFISIDVLHLRQLKDLESVFRVPIFDRYTLVMQIFRMQAVSKEAKLQVSLAELPLLWSRLNDIPTGTVERESGLGESIGGAGETFLEVRKRILREREYKIKQQLKKVRSQRELLRSNRKKQEYPTVAVVGYTNAGKTSLIKALTQDVKLQPSETMFATLDVTNHIGVLPCQLKVLYVDTVGFISDIPTGLIESFIATLEDAILADVLVHVQDLSNPDHKAQADHVIATLHGLRLPESLVKNVVTAGNKVDLLSPDGIRNINCDIVPVSASKNIGLTDLRLEIEKALLKTTGHLILRFKVPMGGDKGSWLYKEAAVMSVEPDPNNTQSMLMKVVITPAKLKKFCHCFGKNIREKTLC